MEGITIRTTDRPTDSDRAIVLDALRRFTREQVPILDNREFAALVRTTDAGIVGGLIGSSRWGGFHVEILALPEPLRWRGLGSELLRLAETEARRRGCHHMLLDTQAFQAKAFYERHGFETFGRIEGPAPYYPRFFMRKIL